MPPNRSCSSLFLLCIKNITEAILHMWKRVEVNRFQELLKYLIKPKKSIREKFCIQVKEHLSLGLNIFVQQALLTNVLKKILNTKFAGVIDLSIENSDADYIKLESSWDLLEDILFIFGREGISILDLSHSDIKSSKSHEANMCIIDIMGQMCNRAIHNTLFKNIEWAKSLVSLKLQNAVDSRTLYCIGMSCQNLQFLYLLTDELMDGKIEDFVSSLSCLYGELPTDWIQTAKPTGCSNMHCLVLPVLKDTVFPILESSMFPVLERKVDCSEHIAKMLCFMSNLKAIKNAPMRSAIRKYISRSTHLEPLKLIEFEDDESENHLIAETEKFANSEENAKIRYVIQNVESYKFSVYSNSNNFNIHEIQQLSNIRRLEVDLYDLDVSWFPIFPLVSDLILTFEDEKYLFDILHINSKFPNLLNLSITAPSLYDYKFDPEPDLCNNNIDMNFPHLTSLYCNVISMDRLLVIKMLIGCPKLTCLKIFIDGLFSSYDYEEPKDFEPLTDEDISMIVPYLANMEVIEFSKVPFNPLIYDDVKQLSLTKASFELLLHSCPKLKWLGCLDTWTISEEEFKMFLSQIRKANFDLHLSYVQRSPWQLIYPHTTECPE